MALGAWNQLDEIGLYIGLERLDGEIDELYYRRIKLFSKWKYRTDYKTQAHSIPLQAGLKTFPIAKFTCTVPYECSLDWEFLTLENFPTNQADKEYYRIFINTNESVLEKIALTLVHSHSFTFTLMNDSYRNIHNNFVVRSKNAEITTDYLGAKCNKLTHGNLLKGSLTPTDKIICKTRKSSLQGLKIAGDYFLDEVAGYLQSFSDNNDGFYVTYKYYQPEFFLEGTELNLIPLNILTKYGVTDDLINILPFVLNGKVWGK